VQLRSVGGIAEGRSNLDVGNLPGLQALVVLRNQRNGARSKLSAVGVGIDPKLTADHRSIRSVLLPVDALPASILIVGNPVDDEPSVGQRRQLRFRLIAVRIGVHSEFATECHAAAYLGRYTIVVDDDIDPTNLNEVLWAVCTRSDPVQDIEILRRCWSGPLDPIIPREKKGFSSRMIIDACRPFEWRERFPPAAEISYARQQAVMAKWKDILSG
jgi:hypothetical protein